jgi:hypothetical protein
MTKQAVVLPVLLLSIFCSAQTRTVSATIDACKTGSPISKYMYGYMKDGFHLPAVHREAVIVVISADVHSSPAER